MKTHMRLTDFYAFRGDGDETEDEVELGFEKSSTDIADWMHSSFS